ncbi:MAG: hypothetical protein RBR87_00310 [Bacteroidales bacterium]|nr:hypothetical protein [Bacteroidales bacterium]
MSQSDALSTRGEQDEPLVVSLSSNAVVIRKHKDITQIILLMDNTL